MFSPYVKYILDDPEEVEVPTGNAFDIMRQQQFRELRLELPIEMNERTSNDRLHNSVLHLLRSKGLQRRRCESRTHCEHFILMLTNLLWYSDGHRDTEEAVFACASNVRKLRRVERA